MKRNGVRQILFLLFLNACLLSAACEGTNPQLMEMVDAGNTGSDGAAVQDGSGSPDLVKPPMGNTAVLAWALVSNTAPDPKTAPKLKCEAVNVVTVRVSLGTSDKFDFPCNSYQGETGPVAIGDYEVQLEALDKGGTSVALIDNVIPTHIMDRTDLGTYYFLIQ